VVAVTTIDSIGLGALQPGRGFALYPIKYKVCSIWKAFSVINHCSKQLSLCVFVLLGCRVPPLQGGGARCPGHKTQQGRNFHADRTSGLLHLKTCERWRASCLGISHGTGNPICLQEPFQPKKIFCCCRSLFHPRFRHSCWETLVSPLSSSLSPSFPPSPFSTPSLSLPCIVCL